VRHEPQRTLFSLENLVRQYEACRRHKRNTANALRFEARQELNLLALRDELCSRSYQPGRSVCFFVKRPKLREVFAADFRDRVVHHVLVSHLETIWEPVFIHDSYACRRGKGVHAGVARLQRFMRQATANGTREAWALQLDVRSYFNSIDKNILFEMLAARLDARRQPDAEALWLCEQLVFHDCTQAPVFKGDRALVNLLPPHKTLFRAPPGKGLPIGNLNSQFFANVYLNALDQFVKHKLKCRWYLRYCDDFVLLAQYREELMDWRERINEFLRERLALQLNDARQRLRPVADGVDFLGYIVRPFHLLVRRRVVGHLREKLGRFRRELVEDCDTLTAWRFDAERVDALQATLASYLGHLRYAACKRVLDDLWRAQPWITTFLELDRTALTLRRRDRPVRGVRNVLAQYRHWADEFAGDEVWIQVGAFVERLQWPPRRLKRPKAGEQRNGDGLRCLRPTRRGAVAGFPIGQLTRRLGARVASGNSVLLVAQNGSMDERLMHRAPLLRWAPKRPV
jgi:retron-type reverse transcriptase